MTRIDETDLLQVTHTHAHAGSKERPLTRITAEHFRGTRSWVHCTLVRRKHTRDTRTAYSFLRALSVHMCTYAVHSAHPSTHKLVNATWEINAKAV